MAFNLVAQLGLRDGGFTSGMRKAQRSMSGLKTHVGGVASTLGALTAGAAVAATAMSSVNKAMDFQANMSTIKALTGATNAEMKQMQSLALEMGAKTRYSALQVSEGMEEMLKKWTFPGCLKSWCS